MTIRSLTELNAYVEAMDRRRAANERVMIEAIARLAYAVRGSAGILERAIELEGLASAPDSDLSGDDAAAQEARDTRDRAIRLLRVSR